MQKPHMRAALRRRASRRSHNEPRDGTIHPSAVERVGGRRRALRAGAICIVVAAGGVALAAQAASDGRAVASTDVAGHGLDTQPVSEDRGAIDRNGDEGLMQIEATGVAVPASIDGFRAPATSPIPHARGHATPGFVVMFDKPGPMEGTIAGSLVVSIRDDVELASQLVDLTSADSTSQATAALGFEPDDTTTVRVEERVVLRSDSTEVIRSPDPRYQDRIYSDYVFASADGTKVIQVVTDALSAEDVFSFIGRIEG